ncbi:cold-regulated protein [Hordeum vulgare]|nr:cold-regulated protein [Hordeum vulgare]
MVQDTLRLVCLPVSAHDGRLPRQYTLEGQGAKKDISPPLEWYGVPGGTRSLALVVQDIDADERVPWMHLVVANKSPEEKGLPEGFLGAGGNANTGGEGGLQEGVNDWKQPDWRGPVPDSQGHRIQFRLYALGDVLSLGNKANREMKTLGGRQDAGLTIWEQGGDDETWTVLTLLPLLLISDIHLAWLIEAAGVGGRGAAGWCRLMLKCMAMEQNQHMWWCRLMLKCTTMEQIRWVVVTSNFSRTAATSLAVLVGSGVALFFRRSSIALA